MTPAQLHILQHSLGCDQYGRSEHRRADEGDGCFGYYRNRYVCDPNDDLRQLVIVGLMTDHGPQSIAGGMHCYTVTVHGEAAMRAESPAPPKVSKSKRRYRAFLNHDCGLRFGEWLKTKWAKEVV